MSLRRAPLLAVAALGVALLASGCGQSTSSDSAKSFTGTQAQVAKVIDDLSAAGKKGDEGKICSDFLATSLTQPMAAKGGCKKVLGPNLEDTDTFGMKVKTVNVTGNTATASVENDGGSGQPKQTSTFSFAKDAAGQWRITSFG